MKKKVLSRHTELDIDRCADLIGGRHTMILVAAKRARFYQQNVNGYSAERAQLDAMFDIQAGLVKAGYEGGPIDLVDIKNEDGTYSRE